MNIMNRVTWRAMWKNRTRTLVTIVGIILSAAMFTAVTTLGVSLLDYMIKAELQNTGNYYIQYDYSTDENLQELQKEETVTDIAALKTLGYTSVDYQLNGYPNTETCIVAAGDDTFFAMVSAHLEEGRLPQNSSEIVITDSFYNALKNSGIPCEIGDVVELDVVPEYEAEELTLPSKGGIAFTKSYKIVGISDSYGQMFNDMMLGKSSLLTYDDGSANGLWYRIFAKTDPVMAAYDLSDLSEYPYGQSAGLNYNMLQLNGGNKYRNFNTLIQNFCIVLAAIIMIGSSSLIYNAFSISVSERTKQFGLLSSIGATRKQLRRSVYFEALSLCAIGIPLGILFGYLGIAVTLHLTHGMIESFLNGVSEHGIILKAIPSIPAFVCAGLISLVTVLISCRIPARRATKIAPISAIRQTQEYDASKANVKVSKLTTKLFGLPGIMAKKYYTVSKKKYRSTVFSITISVVLFISAFSFTTQLRGVAQENANTYNYDIEIMGISQEAMDEIRALPSVEQSTVHTDEMFITFIPDDAFADGYVKTWNESIDYSGTSVGYSNVKYVYVNYLEDDVFKAYLNTHKIDPAPYFDSSSPAALVVNADDYIYSEDDTGNPIRIHYHEKVLQDNISSVDLYPDVEAFPEEVHKYLNQIDSPFYLDISSYEGMPVYTLSFDQSALPEHLDSIPFLMKDGSISIIIKQEKLDGTTKQSFYLFNPETKQLDTKPLAETTRPDTDSGIRLGAAIDELPFGISATSDMETLTLIMPLSMANTGNADPMLSIKVADYQKTIDFLDEQEYYYADYLNSQMQYRNYITLINVFCYGFIVLISLICVCNVFNTISTNIALRRKDFGMLRSVGMKNSEIYRMMAFECLQYGIKALLFGLPLSILSSIGIHLIAMDVSRSGYHLPIVAILIATCCVFFIVFITMTYAVSKLKKDNPIEAIRAESV